MGTGVSVKRGISISERHKQAKSCLQDLLTALGDRETTDRLLLSAELMLLTPQTDYTSVVRKAFDLSDIRISDPSYTCLLNLLNAIDSWQDPHTTRFQDLRVLLQYMEPCTDSGTERIQPIVTLPPEIRDKLPSIIALEIPETISAVRGIIDKAENELFMVAAFAHEEGAKLLAPRIASATKRGVRVTLVTQPPGSTYHPQTAIKIIEDSVSDLGDCRRLDIKYINLLEGNLHAKVFIADKAVAYIGSANLTGHALIRNIEAGALIKGSEVKPLQDLFEFVIRGLPDVGNRSHQIADN